MSIETTTPQSTISDVERVKRAIYEEWQSPAIVAAYRKWEAHESAWGSGPSALLAEHAHVAPGMTVLDLASGHGEPALALAAETGPTGHVTATDQGLGLLAIAEERAQRMGLRNITFRVADAHALPFPDGAFDRVTSRFGLMYFVELQRALRETLRVLKPGGRATFMVWDTPAQPFIEIFVGSLFRHIAPPEPEPGAPDPFMFAASGTLTVALSDAGYREVVEERAIVETHFPGTTRQYWDWFWEMIPPLRPLLDALSPEQRQAALEDALTALQPYDDGEQVVIPIHVIVGSGIR